MGHYIIGYAMDRSLPGVTERDARCLTHLNLAFGLIKDGRLDLSMLPSIGMAARFKQWAPGLRVVLSVGGWGAGGFSEMAMTEEGRRVFAASCLEAAERYGLDGIDIDWGRSASCPWRWAPVEASSPTPTWTRWPGSWTMCS